MKYIKIIKNISKYSLGEVRYVIKLIHITVYGYQTFSKPVDISLNDTEIALFVFYGNCHMGKSSYLLHPFEFDS